MVRALLDVTSKTEVPTKEVLKAFLLYQERELDDERLAGALRAHQALRPLLRQMRAVELPYLWPIEPGHVFQWIEAGGTTPVR